MGMDLIMEWGGISVPELPPDFAVRRLESTATLAAEEGCEEGWSELEQTFFAAGFELDQDLGLLPPAPSRPGARSNRLRVLFWATLSGGAVLLSLIPPLA